MELAGGGKRALVIANTCDTFAQAERAPRVRREISALQGLDFQAEELDLRDYFDGGRSRTELSARLDACDLLWARGGNSFIYRRAMRQSGFDELLLDLLSRDALVYGGYSGGIAVLAPSLEGIEIVNDPEAVPAGYDPGVIRDGLGLIPFSIAPHYKSNHFASPGIDLVVQYFIDHGMPYKTLHDGEAIVVDGDREELIA
ncbi:MAG: serine peptidase [Fibrobacteres bacterium]|nr:serine peptidase [Fibrobacterota bacterium]